MAASSITPQNITIDGVAATYAAANVDGNFCTNDGKTAIHIKNGSGSPVTITVNSIALDNYGFDHNPAYVIAATSELVIGYLSPKRFNDTLGNVNWTYSSVTTVTVAALKVVG